MMDDRRVADYFVVAGLPEDLEPVDDISKDGYQIKWYHTKPPITDIAVVFSSLGETCPKDYEIIEETPTGGSMLILFSLPRLGLSFNGVKNEAKATLGLFEAMNDC